MKKYNVVIVGGGSTWTPGLLQSLTKNKNVFPLNRLVLFDIDAERQKIIGEYAKVLFKEKYPELDFQYTTDKEIAYKNMDFVFCQMRTGGYAMRELDEKIPLKFGVIGQETCGPGGFAYGMRSIRDMLQMIEDVRKYSPNAWILNYTNPAAIVAEAINRVYKDDKRILNICDQPVNLLRSYGRLLDMDPYEFEPVYFGLNHFGWFTHLYDKFGNDLVPKIKEIIKRQGFKPVDAEQRDQSWLDTYSIVKDMLEDFPDYLPNTYLQYYYYPEYKVKKLDPNYTRANEVMDGREKRVFAECRLVAEKGTTAGSSVVHNDAHGDMIVEVAESIAHNKNRIYIIITENNGLISNIQDDAMVEVAAILGVNGPRPFGVGKIGTFYKGLMEQQLAYEKLTVDAYFEQSYEKALQALTLNRTVVDAKKARKILDELIKANKGYWPELKKGRSKK
ncbi:maltose-6'-phosphate glucosidase [Anaerobranca californiensis DSM 14826]|jgi:maltose-6'-phosphate glucosidase|uniref:Maltose-6'-phosphate glucosidase n=1 Tax=Anaerobranca californiensis DSM 14826 TaxID=1120989 RepID=A0A1M6MUN6_9FIRM|nr:6-phospho-alpha-glucosidase [Anaerobranca californiensis]SHJ87136.1 maltose-6'-phosphate glucosidase [Anaerobranca californiensis DSM 14826]